jgi:putative serine protease PepD
MDMTDNPTGAPGGQPEPAEHTGEPAKADLPEPGASQPAESQPAGPTPAQPADEPSPWAPDSGYQYQQPAEQVAPASGEQPTQHVAPQPGAQPILPGVPSGGEQPAGQSWVGGEQPGWSGGATTPPQGATYGASGYPQTGEQPVYGQPIVEQQPGGYPGYYPQTGQQQTQTLPGQSGPKPHRSTGLLVGVAVLALVIGGLAGSLGGYLFSGSGGSGSATSSLSEPSGSGSSASAPAGSAQAVAQSVAPTVVEIAVTFTQQQQGAEGDTGSGVIISSDGQILTNNHVVAGAANGAGTIQVVFANGKIANASIVGRDPTTDIAVIKVQGVSGLPTAKLGNSDAAAVGQQVIAIGAPFQLAGTVTQGIVSSLHRPVAAGDSNSSTAQETVLDAIQTDAAINPGNSGGALVNMSGEIIGINSAIYSPSSADQQSGSSSGNVGIGFAIPMNQAKRIATQLTSTGQATQTVLGVGVVDSVPGGTGGQASCESGAIVTNGAQISTVTAGGPADKAGVKVGDVVVNADGQQVNSCDGLVAAVHAAAPGDQMKLTLSNGTTLTATLSGQPVKLNG